MYLCRQSQHILYLSLRRFCFVLTLLKKQNNEYFLHVQQYLQVKYTLCTFCLRPLKKSIFDKLLYWRRNMHSHSVQAVHAPRKGLSSLKSLCHDRFLKGNFEVLGFRATTVEDHQAGLLPVSCPFISCSGFGTSSLIVQSTLISLCFFFLNSLDSRSFKSINTAFQGSVGCVSST